MRLSVRRFQTESGERFLILVDDAGMPLYYPALFVTAVLRGGNRAINTISHALTAIKLLYAWDDYYCVDLESRFKRSELLFEHEIHSLRDFSQKRLADTKPNEGKVTSIKRRQRLVSTESQFNRMSVIADYVGFIAGRLYPVTATSAKDISAMVAMIKANRPRINELTEKDSSDTHLDDGLLDALEDVIRPGGEANPIADSGIQVRNALMFTILRLTGMRRGELLNLKIDDFDFKTEVVRVVRRPDSAGDPRQYQPLAKTRERTLPLTPEVMERISDYITKYRNKVPGARKHGFLFVTHKAGPNQGWPISNSGFGKFIFGLTEIASNLEGFHSHALRHHWNYVFSRLVTEKGITPEREEKLRSYLMGWSETSGTASTYNRRHIREEAGKAVIELQNKRLRKLSDENK
ncbi:site-specific integrase [Pseudomonas sp. MTM4]|uniref:Integrase n=1 Tax=Stutzerimonas stutzeri KOS6 TaxID=1218352 RepID=A0A061JLH5_STUST|nr:site-specific integrase [Pseudomonas sp. MT4]EWC39190.1 integrase [Stutzerimonas stutzeri KOS6]MBC8651590.1 site-specific integrase [Pseudomonas sp. MT4]QXY94152.1 site-specific integrase [Pseudomonas sp. MTM4]